MESCLKMVEKFVLKPQREGGGVQRFFFSFSSSYPGFAGGRLLRRNTSTLIDLDRKERKLVINLRDNIKCTANFKNKRHFKPFQTVYV